MSDPKRPKAMSLKANVPAIRSAVVKPAPPAYAEFDRFAELADKLAEAHRQIDKVLEALVLCDEAPNDLARDIERAERHLKDRPKLEKLLARFKAAEKFYDRDELYEQRYVDDDHPQMIGEKFVSDQLTLLVGAFPNSVPHSPEVFTKMLFEEVKAYNPHAIILESACRVLRREKNFVPTVAEMLKALKEEDARWCDRWAATDDDSNVLDALTYLAGEVLPDAKIEQADDAEKIAAAYKDGRAARANSRRCDPPDYNGDRRTKALCAAWQRGWEDEQAAIVKRKAES